MAVDEDLRTIKHQNFDMINMRSNLIFCSKTVKDHPSEAGVFFVGAEDKSMHKFTYDKTDNSLEELIQMNGHQHSVKNIILSKDCKTILSCSQDHNLRLWDYTTCKAHSLLCGHTDLVVIIFINKPYIFIVWCLLHEPQHHCQQFLGSKNHDLVHLSIKELYKSTLA